MSAQDSESEYITESGRRDSAYMQGPSRALLGLQSARPRIQDWDTDKDIPGPDFATKAYEFREGPASVPRSLPRNCSTMDTSFTSLTPSLSSGSSAGSDSSIQSSAAGSVVRSGPFDHEGFYVDRSECPGVSVDHQPTLISCLYRFLGCDRTSFADARGWYEHSQSHFRGQMPPNNLRCPYSSCPWTVSGANGEESWRKRWAHLQAEHDVLADGEALCEKRDGRLFEHLWKTHVIDSAQLQELRRSGRLRVDRQPYVTTEKPERRRQRPTNPRMSRYRDT